MKCLNLFFSIFINNKKINKIKYKINKTKLNYKKITY